MGISEFTRVDTSIMRTKQWLNNPVPIVEKVLDYRDRCAFQLTYSGYTASEIPICTVMQELELPDGFTSIPMDRGNVYIFGEDGTYRRKFSHSYATDGTYILCLTFGQFLDYQSDEYIQLIPGLRINQYKEKAPGLVYDLGSGVAALFGRRDDIFNKTGLVYEEIPIESEKGISIL